MNKMSTLLCSNMAGQEEQCVNVSDNSTRGCVTDSALSGKGMSEKCKSKVHLCVCVCVCVCVFVQRV